LIRWPSVPIVTRPTLNFHDPSSGLRVPPTISVADSLIPPPAA
jgi:hypothetical protein